MKINLNIVLTKEQEDLLRKISLEKFGYEPLNSYKLPGWDDGEFFNLTVLDEAQLINSVNGEIFYITDIGKAYLKKKK